MKELDTPGGRIRTGWATALARVTAAILLFELISGLAITFGPVSSRHRMGPAAAHAGRHCFVAAADLVLRAALAGLCRPGDVGRDAARLRRTGRAGCMRIVGSRGDRAGPAGARTTPLAAIRSPDLDVDWRWPHRFPTSSSRGCGGAAASSRNPPPDGSRHAVIVTLAGVCPDGGTRRSPTRGRSTGTSFRPDYHYLYGKDRPFAPSLAHTATNGAFDARSLAGFRHLRLERMPHADLRRVEAQRTSLRRHGPDLPGHSERDGEAEWPGIDALLRRMSRSDLAVLRNQEHLRREAHRARRVTTKASPASPATPFRRPTSRATRTTPSRSPASICGNGAPTARRARWRAIS